MLHTKSKVWNVRKAIYKNLNKNKNFIKMSADIIHLK